MPRGRPDYYPVTIIESKLFLEDNFSNPPLQWAGVGIGGGAISFNHTLWREGSASLLITTGNTAVGDWAEASRNFGCPITQILRAEVWFSLPLANGQYLEIGILRGDGTIYQWGFVRYDVVNQRWQYCSGFVAGVRVFTNIPNGAQALGNFPWIWNVMSLGVDVASRRYISLRVNEDTWDLSAFAIPTGLAAPHSDVAILIRGSTNAIAAVDYNIDSVLVGERI